MKTKRHLTPLAYSIIHPNKWTRRKANGHYIASVHTDPRNGLTLSDLFDMQEEGLITVHTIGGNDLGNMFGRTDVTYSVN